jgi:hypothetical protein
MAPPKMNSVHELHIDHNKNVSESLHDLIHICIPKSDRRFHLKNMCLSTTIRTFLIEKAKECRHDAFFFTREIARLQQTIRETHKLFSDKERKLSSLERLDYSIKYINLISYPEDSIENVFYVFFNTIYERIKARTVKMQDKIVASCMSQVRSVMKLVDRLIFALVHNYRKDSESAFLCQPEDEFISPKVRAIKMRKREAVM